LSSRNTKLYHSERIKTKKNKNVCRKRENKFKVTIMNKYLKVKIKGNKIIIKHKKIFQREKSNEK
jgi:hypothetical protein